MAATVSRIRRVALDLALVAFAVSRAGAVGGSAVRQRIAADAGSGVPLVAHVIVALCDNESQGIVPVPARLGNGHDPGSNL